MVAFALEELNRRVPQCDEWLKVVVQSRNSDGSYGQGPGIARTTALHVVTKLRLGGKLESAEATLKILQNGQRKDGGFGGDKEGGSDLGACYRVVRVVACLDAQPIHPEKLTTFNAVHPANDAVAGNSLPLIAESRSMMPAQSLRGD